MKRGEFRKEGEGEGLGSMGGGRSGGGGVCGKERVRLGCVGGCYGGVEGTWWG